MKEPITKFDLEAAFKALDEIEMPNTGSVKANRPALNEIFSRKTKFDALMEEYYDVGSMEELGDAKESREAEVAQAKLARIEKIVDLDAESPEDLLPSYVGKFIMQCPQCMTLFYKNPEDVEASEEDPDVVNVAEVCQHCGNESGYTLIGKVGAATEEEMSEYAQEETVDVTSTEEGEEEPTEELTDEEPSDDELDINLDELDELDLEIEDDEAEKAEEAFNPTNGGQALVEELTEEAELDVSAEEFENLINSSEFKKPISDNEARAMMDEVSEKEGEVQEALDESHGALLRLKNKITELMSSGKLLQARWVPDNPTVEYLGNERYKVTHCRGGNPIFITFDLSFKHDATYSFTINGKEFTSNDYVEAQNIILSELDATRRKGFDVAVESFETDVSLEEGIFDKKQKDVAAYDTLVSKTFPGCHTVEELSEKISAQVYKVTTDCQRIYTKKFNNTKDASLGIDFRLVEKKFKTFFNGYKKLKLSDALGKFTYFIEDLFGNLECYNEKDIEAITELRIGLQKLGDASKDAVKHIESITKADTVNTLVSWWQDFARDIQEDISGAAGENLNEELRLEEGIFDRLKDKFTDTVNNIANKLKSREAKADWLLANTLKEYNDIEVDTSGQMVPDKNKQKFNTFVVIGYTSRDNKGNLIKSAPDYDDKNLVVGKNGVQYKDRYENADKIAKGWSMRQGNGPAFIYLAKGQDDDNALFLCEYFMGELKNDQLEKYLKIVQNELKGAKLMADGGVSGESGEAATEAEVDSESGTNESLDVVMNSVEELKESILETLISNSLVESYGNVAGFRLADCSYESNKFTVAGTIYFTSGNKRNTSYVFTEALVNDNKVSIRGLNEKLGNDKLFTITGYADNKTFITESFKATKK